MDKLKKDFDKPLELKLLNTDFGIFDSQGSYVHCYRMFLEYYNVMPNFRTIDNIAIDLFKKWLEEEYKSEIIKQHYAQDFDSQKKVLKFRDHFYFLEQGIMLNVERKNIHLLYTDVQEARVNLLFEECKKIYQNPPKNNQQQME